MYTPQSFVEADIPRLHEFIEAHSFASLITQADKGTVASHLPLLLERKAGSQGKLVGHMARANTQWRGADGSEALVIFHGPHAYISPTWYEETNVVPTWNYVAVHAHGELHIVSNREKLLQTLRDTIAKYESGSARPWDIEQPDQPFLDGLLDSIVGFEIEITRLEGKWKLSQNHTPQRRRRVIEALTQSVGEQQHQIAALMSQTLSKEAK